MGNSEPPLLPQLRHVTRVLLDPARPAYSLREQVMELKSILEHASGFRFDRSQDISTGETVTDHGVAISPTMASMCVDDFARTVQFIRGVDSAIRHLQSRGKVRVLYAGCGPWATLAVPIMSVRPAEEVSFTLLDIHPESVDCAKQLIDGLDLSRHVEEFVVGDALGYQIEQTNPPDLIVVEMLRAALADEPQVAVASHLINQSEHSLMIPESVRIELALVDRSKEFETVRDRIDLGTALMLDRGVMTTHLIEIPDYDIARYTPMLLTTIVVYGEHVLRDYDSGVTCPRVFKLDGRPGLFEFFYEAGRSPRLSARRVGTYQ